MWHEWQTPSVSRDKNMGKRPKIRLPTRAFSTSKRYNLSKFRHAKKYMLFISNTWWKKLPQRRNKSLLSRIFGRRKQKQLATPNRTPDLFSRADGTRLQLYCCLFVVFLYFEVMQIVFSFLDPPSAPLMYRGSSLLTKYTKKLTMGKDEETEKWM